VEISAAGPFHPPPSVVLRAGALASQQFSRDDAPPERQRLLTENANAIYICGERERASDAPVNAYGKKGGGINKTDTNRGGVLYAPQCAKMYAKKPDYFELC